MKLVHLASLCFMLAVFGIFYLYSSHDWIIVEKAMTNNSDHNSDQRDISLKSLQDDDIDLQAYRHENVFLLFFTTWCPVCEEQWAVVDEVLKQNDTIRVIAVNLTKEERSKTDVRNYVRKLNVSDRVEMFTDDAGKAQQQFSVIGVPTIILIGPEGDILKRSNGFISPEEIAETYSGK